MKRSIVKLPRSEVRIDVSYTTEEFAPYWERALDAACSEVHIKGFRRGTAPKELARTSVDHNRVFRGAIEEAARDALRAASNEEGLQFLGVPKVEIAERNGGVSFSIKVAVFPDVQLGDYKKIARGVMQEKRELAVSDEEVENAVKWLLKSRKAEELTDEFARGVGNFKNAEDLKTSIREGLLEEKAAREVDRKRAKMIEEIARASKIDLPAVMVERVLDQMVEDLKATLEAGGVNFNDYVAKHYKTFEELRASFLPRAEASVAGNLVINKIAEIEKLEPTPDEVEEEANKMMLRHYALDPKQAFDYSYGTIRAEKVYKFLESQI
jgi:FKBP-type peptidyl-prolyl cis-trans isomerase (trigger factor)